MHQPALSRDETGGELGSVRHRQQELASTSAAQERPAGTKATAAR